MVRGSFGMVGFIMVAKVLMVFYWVVVRFMMGFMVRVVVGLVIGIMVDPMTMVC